VIGRATDRAVGAVLVVLALALALGLPLPGLGAAVTGLSLALWGAASALEHVPVLGATGDARILLDAALLAALFSVPTKPGRARLVGHVGAVPALLGLAGLLLFGLGLGGWLAVVAVGGAVLLPHPERGPSADRRVLAGALFAGWAALFALHALYVSGPGIQPAPVADRGFWGAVQDGLSALPGGAWVEPVASAFGVAAAVGASKALRGAGVPLRPRAVGGPAQWVVAFAHLAGVVGLAASGPWLARVWRCPDAQDLVRVLDPRPGVFQLAVVGDQLWANDREERETRRYALPGGAALPPVRWEDAVPDAWPEELIPLADGGAWVALVVGEDDGSLVVPLDADGAPGPRFPLPGCFVASSARLSGGDVLLGCEYAPDFLRLDPRSGEVKERFAVPGLGSAEAVEVIADRAYAVGLWDAPWLVEIDPTTHRAVRSRFAGDFNWDLAWSPGSDLLAVPRFLQRTIDLYDRATLAPRGHLPGEFGARPIVFDGERQAFYVAGTFSGRLRAAALDGRTRALRVGGLVRSLALRGDTLYLGGRCGVQAVDVAAWGGAP
jgi:hypothetical protein